MAKAVPIQWDAVPSSKVPLKQAGGKFGGDGLQTTSPKPILMPRVCQRGCSASLCHPTHTGWDGNAEGPQGRALPGMECGTLHLLVLNWLSHQQKGDCTFQAGLLFPLGGLVCQGQQRRKNWENSSVLQSWLLCPNTSVNEVIVLFCLGKGAWGGLQHPQTAL